MNFPSQQSGKNIQDLVDDTRPFALLKHRSGNTVQLFQGQAFSYDHLNDIPIRTGIPRHGECVDSISAIPFRQIEERGFEACHQGEKITTIIPGQHSVFSLQDTLDHLPAEEIGASEPAYRYSNEEYGGIVRSIQEDVIGQGKGSNFVIANRANFNIPDMNRAKALSIFRRLLEVEFGSYMHFLYYDGLRYLIGASPERHLTVAQGRVTMNPISGTFRKDGRTLLQQFRQDFIRFLHDEKEVKELFKVLDEELKMMSEMCEGGGYVAGPMLREMAKLIHTEFELIGFSRKRVIDLLRMSMFAPTVIGGPLESASSIIRQYEAESRGFYSGVFSLISRDPHGGEKLDSGISIRMMEITPHGDVTARAGATIVQDSDPHSEALEIRAKLGGILSACTSQPASRLIISSPNNFEDETEIQQVLSSRRDRLSQFFLEDQKEADLSIDSLRSAHITIIDNGDNFCQTLKHIIDRMGPTVIVQRFDEFESSTDSSDILIIGPGPGDPSDFKDQKMQKLYSIVDARKKSGNPMLGICLGHQILCHSLGMQLRKNVMSAQGEQRRIHYFGKSHLVGTYNTFSAVAQEIDGVEVSYDETNSVNATRGQKFSSMQFHPESVLSMHGFHLLSAELIRLFTQKNDSIIQNPAWNLEE